MIKKLVSVIVITLALNFVAAVGGVGYLFLSHKLDQSKMSAIRGVVFPTTVPAVQPTTLPAVAATKPVDRLGDLLAKTSGKPAADQIEIMQTSFDSQSAQIDRRLRELYDLQDQVRIAKEALERDRAALDSGQKALTAQQAEAGKLATDEGFQSSLSLYRVMPAKRVKEIFKTLDDEVVVRYLQAMDTRQAGNVLKEFKTPEEISRAQALLERVRLAQAAKVAE